MTLQRSRCPERRLSSVRQTFCRHLAVYASLRLLDIATTDLTYELRCNFHLEISLNLISRDPYLLKKFADYYVQGLVALLGICVGPIIFGVDSGDGRPAPYSDWY